MPEHLHLLLRGTNILADAWAAMAAFKQRSGFWIAVNRPELSWQKNYWDHVTRRGEDLRAQIRYIADNPVRRGLVTEWGVYRVRSVMSCTSWLKEWEGWIGDVRQSFVAG